MSDINKYMEQIREAFPESAAQDVYSIGKQTFDAVGKFLVSHGAAHPGQYDHIMVASESLSFDDALTTSGIEELQTLVKSCGISDAYVRPCCQSILNIMDRCLAKSAPAAWTQQNRKADALDNNRATTHDLSEIYASDTVTTLRGGYIPSQEAFGVNVDLAVPDLKVAISVAIMNFHTRLLPRILPVKSTTTPNVQYTKEFLEVYDLKSIDGKRQRLVDLYENPLFAANELQKIVPLMAISISTFR